MPKIKKMYPEVELNHRPLDFQSNTLPTELSGFTYLMLFSIKETPNTNNWTAAQIIKWKHENYNDINELYDITKTKNKELKNTNSKSKSTTYLTKTKKIFFFFRLKQWATITPPFIQPNLKKKTNIGLWLKNEHLPLFPNFKKNLTTTDVTYKLYSPGLLTNYAIQQKKNLSLNQNSTEELLQVELQAYPHLIIHFNIDQTTKIFNELKHIPIPHISTQNISSSNYFQPFPFFINSHKNFYFLNKLFQTNTLSVLPSSQTNPTLFYQNKKSIQKKNKKNNNIFFEHLAYKKLVKKLACNLVFKPTKKTFLQHKKRLLLLKKISFFNNLKNFEYKKKHIKNIRNDLKKKQTFIIKTKKNTKWAKPFWSWKTDRYIYIRYKNYLQKLFKKISNLKNSHIQKNINQKTLINKKNTLNLMGLSQQKKYQKIKLSQRIIKKKKFIFFFKKKHHVLFLKRYKIRHYFKNNLKTFKNLSLLFFVNLLRLQQKKNTNFIFSNLNKVLRLKKYKFSNTWNVNKKWIKKQTRIFLKYPRYFKRKILNKFTTKKKYRRKQKYLLPVRFLIKNWKLVL